MLLVPSCSDCVGISPWASRVATVLLLQLMSGSESQLVRTNVEIKGHLEGSPPLCHTDRSAVTQTLSCVCAAWDVLHKTFKMPPDLSEMTYLIMMLRFLSLSLNVFSVSEDSYRFMGKPYFQTRVALMPVGRSVSRPSLSCLGRATERSARSGRPDCPLHTGSRLITNSLLITAYRT